MPRAGEQRKISTLGCNWFGWGQRNWGISEAVGLLGVFSFLFKKKHVLPTFEKKRKIFFFGNTSLLKGLETIDLNFLGCQPLPLMRCISQSGKQFFPPRTEPK